MPTARSGSTGSHSPTRARGATKLTVDPSGGPKASFPRAAIGFSSAPQPDSSTASKWACPDSATTAAASCCRLIGVPVSTPGTVASSTAMSSAVTLWQAYQDGGRAKVPGAQRRDTGTAPRPPEGA